MGPKATCLGCQTPKERVLAVGFMIQQGRATGKAPEGIAGTGGWTLTAHCCTPY